MGSALAGLLGGAGTVEVILHTPAGPVLHQLDLDDARATPSRARPPGADTHGGILPLLCTVPACVPPCQVGLYCGPDVGHDILNYPNSCGVEVWVQYRGAPPGSAFTALEPAPEGPPWLGCSWLPPASPWALVELSAAKHPAVLAGLEQDGCWGPHWLLHKGSYCSNIAASPVPDTFLLRARGRGVGFAVSIVLGDGSVVDWFVLQRSVVCLDLPAGFEAEGFAPPCP